MSDRQISLPEEVYCKLVAIADSSGVSPAEWVAAQLPTEPEQYAPDSVWELIGAINSQEEPHQPYDKNPLGEAIAAKLAKQGIHRP